MKDNSELRLLIKMILLEQESPDYSRRAWRRSAMPQVDSINSPGQFRRSVINGSEDVPVFVYYYSRAQASRLSDIDLDSLAMTHSADAKFYTLDIGSRSRGVRNVWFKYAKFIDSSGNVMDDVYHPDYDVMPKAQIWYGGQPRETLIGEFTRSDIIIGLNNYVAVGQAKPELDYPTDDPEQEAVAEPVSDPDPTPTTGVIEITGINIEQLPSGDVKVRITASQPIAPQTVSSYKTEDPSQFVIDIMDVSVSAEVAAAAGADIVEAVDLISNVVTQTFDDGQGTFTRVRFYMNDPIEQIKSEFTITDNELHITISDSCRDRSAEEYFTKKEGYYFWASSRSTAAGCQPGLRYSYNSDAKQFLYQAEPKGDWTVITGSGSIKAIANNTVPEGYTTPWDGADIRALRAREPSSTPTETPSSGDMPEGLKTALRDTPHNLPYSDGDDIGIWRLVSRPQPSYAKLGKWYFAPGPDANFSDFYGALTEIEGVIVSYPEYRVSDSLSSDGEHGSLIVHHVDDTRFGYGGD